MIKCANNTLIADIKNLFNVIFDSEYYPKTWNHGLIKSIFKTGAKEDPSNYRGITLMSCLGKVYSTVLYKRIETEIENNDLISNSGFRKIYRTTDHIYTFFTLITKYIKKGNKLYTCFVDFRKAYDSICRKRLAEKLKQIGINGRMLKTIETMYISPKLSLICNDKITETFESKIGLKQGDVLSTLLFNIFINDLPEILIGHSNHSKNEEIPELDKTKINSLLFADDLTILSLSKEDLQNRINILEEYCVKWGLDLNLSKTKVLIFNKQGDTIRKDKFFYNKKEIDITEQYTYLGFIFVPSGKKHKGIENLINKAWKSWFATQKLLQKSNEKTINVYIKLFETVVKPIALYACESWGDHYKKNRNFQKIEKLQTSIFKQILGVPKTTNNMKVLAEMEKFPLKINIEIQMFKYLQRFPFLKDNSYLSKAFKEQLKVEKNDKTSWITNLGNILDSYGLPNLMVNILDVTKGKIKKEEYKNKHKFFEKRTKDVYIQEQFFAYLNKIEDNNSFYKIKQTYTKERYLNLSNFENRRAICKLRTSTFKLGAVLAKWYKNDENIKLCKYCNSEAIETEIHFFFDCKKYNDLRNDMIEIIKNTENIDLKKENRLENLTFLFSNGKLQSLNTIGKFIKEAFELRTKNE